MSWRRFSTLLRGLGPQSASASRAYLRKYNRDGGQAPAPEVAPITDKAEAAAAFKSLFGGDGRPAAVD